MFRQYYYQHSEYESSASAVLKGEEPLLTLKPTPEERVFTTACAVFQEKQLHFLPLYNHIVILHHKLILF